MNSEATDPGRFRRYRESAAVTLMRTGAIAIVVASAIWIIRFRHVPMSFTGWRGWLALVVSVAWISFGGHWVELAYLNGLRPGIAGWRDSSLVGVRLAVWLIGGTILSVAAIATHRLLTAGEFPGQAQVVAALLYGGVVFVVVEMVAHLFLLLGGRPSFWNLRG